MCGQSFLTMIKQDMCWFNYRTWWCCGMYPSTMGNIWIMMINYQWWGFTNYLLCLTWGIPQLQPSLFQKGITLINKWIGYSIFRHTHIVASKKCQTMFFQNGSSIWKRRPVSSRFFLSKFGPRKPSVIDLWSIFPGLHHSMDWLKGTFYRTAPYWIGKPMD